MKYTLKDYQEEAVLKVLENLKKARKRWREDRDPQAFALSAVTGAGKTVMAAAVIEALFLGDDTYAFDRDPGAVVLWFSDDPSLNEQTRFRLGEASDRLNSGQYVVVQESFQQEKFDANKIYFLNTQKLGKNSLLVRGHESSPGTLMDVRPDNRQYTIWDTIRNTIRDERQTLYLVVDEAHRGMGKRLTGTERKTIVQRLINGHGDVPPVPIVLGISATIQRFQEEMRSATGRQMLANVEVDPVKVQESGLLKSAIVVDLPDEKGDFETVLLSRAAAKIRSLDEAWRDYSREQELPEPVAPLLVFQVPDKPNPDDVGRWIATIREHWPELPNHTDAICHVFGDHVDQYFGGIRVPHVAPQLVQGRPGIRVLLAKSAISTGWDCPRAEVMVSFRSAADETHITQLIGRMVRTPLARSIAGNDRLNSVECLLPRFDRPKVERIVDLLMRGGDDGEPPVPNRRVLFNPEEMKPNDGIPKAVWDKFRNLPSERLPKVVSHPVQRLAWLATELSGDRLLEGAVDSTYRKLIAALDGLLVQFDTEIKLARQGVLQVDGMTILANLVDKEKSYDYFVERADRRVVLDVLRVTRRVLTLELTKRYVVHRSETTGVDLEEAEATVAALGLVPEIKHRLFAEAKRLAEKYFSDYRVAIRGLSDARRDKYDEIKEWTSEPTPTDLVKPLSRYENTKTRDVLDEEALLTTYDRHLLSNGNGQFPFEGNEWEVAVLQTEMARDGFVGWYRNPAGGARESLGIAYKMGDKDKIMRPDFIFFSRIGGQIVADIVDPHGGYFADTLPRLQGMARFAMEHGSHFRRIEMISKVGDRLRVLDLQDASTRAVVLDPTPGSNLFGSGVAFDYH